MSELRYYVYELVDPRTGWGFYIGKGSGNRWRQHLHRRKPRNLPNAGNFVKALVIDGVRKAGLEIECRKLGLFRDETTAYEFESELIAEAFREGRQLANYNDGISPEKLARRRA